jgi:hypothetical protein
LPSSDNGCGLDELSGKRATAPLTRKTRVIALSAQTTWAVGLIAAHRILEFTPSMTLTPSAPPTAVTATPERISELTKTLLARIRGSIKEISDINLQARVLSINAQIEAARAGESGRAFAIVAQEMATFSDRTQRAAVKLEEESEVLVLELAEISRQLATDVRGTRLCDLALTNIDLIDRNLYERTCDCRWWATDGAIVAALETRDETSAKLAAHRMGVILNAYTVYFDIVLADLEGVIIANGRPAAYSSQGLQQGKTVWFQTALASGSGDEFGFQSVQESQLAGGRRVLVYSCKVCAGGDAKSKAIGVLGVVFNWDSLAQKIVHETPIEESKRAATRVCIVDDQGTVLADSGDRVLQERLELPERSALFAEKKGSRRSTLNGAEVLVAHARSPGFETYRTGWHSLIIEELA